MANRWAAARLRLRSEVRTRRAGMALLVAVVAIASGVTMAAARGARRSDTAYARFRVWAHDPDLSASGCECTNEQAITNFARLRGAPFVLDSAEMNYAELIPQLPDGTQPSSLAFLPVIDVGNRLGREIPRVKMLHGRLPDPTAADEAALGFVTAERFHLAVDDALKLLAADPRRKPPVVGTVRIVGIYAASGELPSASGPSGNSFLLTSAFGRSIPDLIEAKNDTVMVRLRPGASRSTAVAFIRTLGFDVNDAADLTSGIRKTIGIETIALLLLAAVVAAVGLVVVGQMLRRQAAPAGDEGVTFAALGADRADTLGVGFLRGSAVGLAGAALGVVIAIAMSPLFPVGIGRIADPDLGLHTDVIVLGLGAILTLGATTALGLLATITTTHRRRRSAGGATTRWRPRAGPAPVLVGLSFALPGRSHQPSPRARVSLLSLVVVVVALAATTVTLASFDHLVARRDLAGATWQGVFLPSDASDPASLGAAIGAVRAVPGVEAATIGTWATTGGGSAPGLYVNRHLLGAQIFGDDGTIRPAIRHGRAPSALGEVALGSKTMAELGVRIGDAVDLSLEPGGRSARGVVVGDVVLASPFFFDFAPGTGAATTMSTFTSLGSAPDRTLNTIVVRYENGADAERTFSVLQKVVGNAQGFEASDRHAVTGLSRIRIVPVLLLVGLLALVAAAVAHVLLVSVAGHRRDVAVLRAMGFTKPQSWGAISLHACLLAVAACVVGIPIGVVLGRAAWDRIAADLFVVPRPIAPLELLTLICVALVAVAVVASLVPAALVRPRPAVVLRAD